MKNSVKIPAPIRTGGDKQPVLQEKRIYKIITRTYSSRDLLFFFLTASLIIRIIFVFKVDFPLNDGGLFYPVVEDIGNNNFRLPFYFNYNKANIPFAYPPLGFYAAAALTAVMGISVLDVLHIVPLIISILAVGAFYLLTAEITRNKSIALICATLFASMPRTFEWTIMGAGLTRSFGFFFALLCLWQTSYALRTGKALAVGAAGLFTGLTFLSHPEQSVFVLSSQLVMFFAYRRMNALISIARIILIGLFVAAPWVFLIVSRHGIEPFVSSFQTGEWLGYGVISLLTFQFMTQSSTVILVFLQLAGLLYALVRGNTLLVLWAFSPFLLSGRNAELFASVPLTIMAGTFVHSFLWPRISHIRSKNLGKHMNLMILSTACITVFIFFHILVIPWISLSENIWNRNALSKNHRNGMEWVAHNTSEDSQFIIVNDIPDWLYMADSLGEWFPAITKRVNVSVLQGYEWVPNQEFARRRAHLKALKDCFHESLYCYEAWAEKNRIRFTHFFIQKETYWTGDECCRWLQDSLEQSSRYIRVYENDDVSVWVKN